MADFSLVELDVLIDRLTSQLVTKYRPDQPRDPRGTPTGGRWTAGGGTAVRATAAAATTVEHVWPTINTTRWSPAARLAWWLGKRLLRSNLGKIVGVVAGVGAVGYALSHLPEHSRVGTSTFPQVEDVLRRRGFKVLQDHVAREGAVSLHHLQRGPEDNVVLVLRDLVGAGRVIKWTHVGGAEGNAHIISTGYDAPSLAQHLDTYIVPTAEHIRPRTLELATSAIGGSLVGAALGTVLPPDAAVPLSTAATIAIDKGVRRLIHARRHQRAVELQQQRQARHARRRMIDVRAPQETSTAKYSPDQPRAPKGTPTGGEWVAAHGAVYAPPTEHAVYGSARDLQQARARFHQAPLALPTIVNQQRRGTVTPEKVAAVLRTLPPAHLRGVRVQLRDVANPGRPTRNVGNYSTRTGRPTISLYGTPHEAGRLITLSPHEWEGIVRHEVGHHVQTMYDLLHDPEWQRVAETVRHGHGNTFGYARKYTDPYAAQREIFGTAYALYTSDPARLKAHYPAIYKYLRRKVPDMQRT